MSDLIKFMIGLVLLFVCFRFEYLWRCLRRIKFILWVMELIILRIRLLKNRNIIICGKGIMNIIFIINIFRYLLS